MWLRRGAACKGGAFREAADKSGTFLLDGRRTIAGMCEEPESFGTKGCNGIAPSPGTNARAGAFVCCASAKRAADLSLGRDGQRTPRARNRSGMRRHCGETERMATMLILMGTLLLIVAVHPFIT